MPIRKFKTAGRWLDSLTGEDVKIDVLPLPTRATAAYVAGLVDHIPLTALPATMDEHEAIAQAVASAPLACGVRVAEALASSVGAVAHLGGAFNFADHYQAMHLIDRHCGEDTAHTVVRTKPAPTEPGEKDDPAAEPQNESAPELVEVRKDES